MGRRDESRQIATLGRSAPHCRFRRTTCHAANWTACHGVGIVAKPDGDAAAGATSR